MDNQENTKLIPLLVSSLILLAVTMGVGILLIVMLSRPDLFEEKKPFEGEAKSASSTMARPVSNTVEPVEIENGIDVSTGFVAEGDFMLVRSTCTACHSAKLVLQNRATREGWKEMIVWMQETQKLWDLGENEDKILDYLATHYGPVKKGRRSPVKVNSWYEIQ